MAFIAHLYIEAGTTFAREITYTNEDGTLFNLTDYSAELQVRETVNSETATITKVPTISVSEGTISWTFTAAETGTLTKDKYVYALELTNTDGTVIRLVEGDLTVSPEVVR